MATKTVKQPKPSYTAVQHTCMNKAIAEVIANCPDSTLTKENLRTAASRFVWGFASEGDIAPAIRTVKAGEYTTAQVEATLNPEPKPLPPGVTPEMAAHNKAVQSNANKVAEEMFKRFTGKITPEVNSSIRATLTKVAFQLDRDGAEPEALANMLRNVSSPEQFYSATEGSVALANNYRKARNAENLAKIKGKTPVKNENLARAADDLYNSF